MEGPQVLAALQQIEPALQDDASRVEDEINAGEQQLDETIVRRGETFVELARHYLPAVNQETVDQSFAALKDDLSNLLARRTREVRNLREKIAELEEPRPRLEAELQLLTRGLNEKVRQRDMLEKQLRDRLATDGDFDQLAQQVLLAENRLKQNEQRVDEIQREADEKLPAYQQSKLFGYLYDRGFRTPQYRGWGLTRRLDGWVGSLIDFRRARKSCEFLLVTPKLMADEVDRRRTECQELADRLDAMRATLAESIGLDSVMREGERLGRRRDRVVSELNQIGDNLDGLKNELSEIEQSQGRFYDEAIQRLKKMLEETSTAVLQQRARQTPQPEDDEIVAEINWLNEQTESRRLQIGKLREQARQTDQRQRGIEYVLRRCRQYDIDSERCYFDESLDLEDDIQQFMGGAIDHHELLKRLRRHQQFRPTWGEQTLDKTIKTIEKPGVQMVLNAVAVAGGYLLRRLILNQGRGHQRQSGTSARPNGSRFTSGPGF